MWKHEATCGKDTTLAHRHIPRNVDAKNAMYIFKHTHHAIIHVNARFVHEKVSLGTARLSLRGKTSSFDAIFGEGTNKMAMVGAAGGLIPCSFGAIEVVQR